MTVVDQLIVGEVPFTCLSGGIFDLSAVCGAYHYGIIVNDNPDDDNALFTVYRDMKPIYASNVWPAEWHMPAAKAA